MRMERLLSSQVLHRNHCAFAWLQWEHKGLKHGLRWTDFLPRPQVLHRKHGVFGPFVLMAYGGSGMAPY